MNRIAIVSCAIIIFAAALIGCGRKPAQHAVTQPLNPQTTGPPPKSGYHYPNLPEDLSFRRARVLREAANQQEILKWAKDNYFLKDMTTTANTLDGEWTVVVDDPLSGAVAYEPYVYGLCPTSPTDPKPWKLLAVGFYQPRGYGNNVVQRFRFDAKSLSLIAENTERKTVWMMDLSAEAKLMQERKASSK